MKIQKRYKILVIATIVNFVHGNPYIWTVFQPYVREEYGLSLAASSQPFTVIIGIFAVGNMVGGYLKHKIGARNVILLGHFVMCAGFFTAAMAPYNMPWMILAGYGFLGGLGSGCAFSMLVAVPQAWFPDKKGFVTGITIGTVGISGLLMNPLCDYVLSVHGYRFAMLMTAFIYLVLSFGGFFITEPTQTDEIKKVPAIFRQKKQYSTRELFRTKSYYLISLSMALGIPAYVFVNPLMKSLGIERGLSSDAALAGVLAASLANIIGRLVVPWVTDKISGKAVIQGLYVIAMISVLGITVARGVLFVLFISLVCLTYGGFVSVFSVFTADYFGMKNQGMNYGAVMLSGGAVSILCPMILNAVNQTAYETNLSFIIAGAACVAGMLVTNRIKPPVQ